MISKYQFFYLETNSYCQKSFRFRLFRIYLSSTREVFFLILSSPEILFFFRLKNIIEE